MALERAIQQHLLKPALIQTAISEIEGVQQHGHSILRGSSQNPVRMGEICFIGRSEIARRPKWRLAIPVRRAVELVFHKIHD